MTRYRIGLEYDGGPFRGFQAQDGVKTVQGEIERAILGFSGERVRIHVAGRTDAGVHAEGQVAHFDLARDWPVKVVRDALNAHLAPEPVSVLDVVAVGPDFHARFSATGRRYAYRILNRRAPPALLAGRVWHVKAPLDAGAMAEGARLLLGRHDFTTFRDLACQARSPVKTLDEASVRREGDMVVLEFASRSFLHRQVRSMAGSLAQVGTGRWAPSRIGEALAARDRRACGPVAPACGLYLTAVAYDPPPNAAA